MNDKKSHNKVNKETKISKKKTGSDQEEEFDLKDDHVVEEMLSDEMPGE